MQSKLISYLESQRRDSQWGVFLKAVLDEMTSAVGPDDARRLLVKAGSRAASDLPLPACDSLQQLESAANRHWGKLGMGVATFEERPDSLEISHQLAPSHAVNSEGLGAFLEGVYQQWFLAVGAGTQLQVREYKSAEKGTFLFRLAG